MSSPFDTPILLITYKRADTTRKVIDSLRGIRPSSIYFAANAPNPENPKDPPQCEAVRDLVGHIDWPCEVKTLFRTEHLNARESISGSISWFFENVEEGIILEDDCICDPSFFFYCQENLERYRSNHQVMQISATNFDPNYKGTGESYYFSRYAYIWGWATWRRAWEHFDLQMGQIERTAVKPMLRRLFARKKEASFWSAMYDYLASGKIDTWDGQWLFAVFNKDGLCITPKTNLITNIGFDSNATNTFGSHNVVERMKIGALEFPLEHPESIEGDEDADTWTGDNLYGISKSCSTFHLKIRIATRLPISWKRFLKRYFKK